jgi:hypothetical protein
VLAPAARGRADIVPRPPPPKPRLSLLPPPVRMPRHSHSPWIPWAGLLFRVFGVDAFACPCCSGRLRVHAVVQGVWATTRVLACLAKTPAQTRIAIPRGPPTAA